MAFAIRPSIFKRKKTSIQVELLEQFLQKQKEEDMGLVPPRSSAHFQQKPAPHPQTVVHIISTKEKMEGDTPEVDLICGSVRVDENGIAIGPSVPIYPSGIPGGEPISQVYRRSRVIQCSGCGHPDWEGNTCPYCGSVVHSRSQQ